MAEIAPRVARGEEEEARESAVVRSHGGEIDGGEKITRNGLSVNKCTVLGWHGASTAIDQRVDGMDGRDRMRWEEKERKLTGHAKWTCLTQLTDTCQYTNGPNCKFHIKLIMSPKIMIKITLER